MSIFIQMVKWREWYFPFTLSVTHQGKMLSVTYTCDITYISQIMKEVKPAQEGV